MLASRRGVRLANSSRSALRRGTTRELEFDAEESRPTPGSMLNLEIFDCQLLRAGREPRSDRTTVIQPRPAASRLAARVTDRTLFARGHMTAADHLRASFAAVEVNEEFTEAVLSMRDGSRLCFC